MGEVLEFKQELETTTCSECGLTSALPKSFLARLVDTGRTFYCANGHPQHYADGLAKQQAKEQEAKRSKIIKLFGR